MTHAMKKVFRPSLLTLFWVILTTSLASLAGRFVPNETLKTQLIRILLFPLTLITRMIEMAIDFVGPKGLAEPASMYISERGGIVVLAVSIVLYLAFWYAMAHVGIYVFERRRQKLENFGQVSAPTPQDQ